MFVKGTIFLLEFGNVPTVFLFYSFILLLNVILKGQMVQAVIPNNNNNKRGYCITVNPSRKQRYYITLMKTTRNNLTFSL